jgi:hypothetical protein
VGRSLQIATCICFGLLACWVIALDGAIVGAEEPTLLFAVEISKGPNGSPPRQRAARIGILLAPPSCDAGPAADDPIRQLRLDQGEALGRIIPAAGLGDRGRSRSILQSGSPRKNFSMFQIGRTSVVPDSRDASEKAQKWAQKGGKTRPFSYGFRGRNLTETS